MIRSKSDSKIQNLDSNSEPQKKRKSETWRPDNQESEGEEEEEKLKERKIDAERKFSALFREKAFLGAQLETLEDQRKKLKADLLREEDEINELLPLLSSLRAELDAAKERKEALFRETFQPSNEKDFGSKEVAINSELVANIERLKRVQKMVRYKAARGRKVTVGTQTCEEWREEGDQNEKESEEVVEIGAPSTSKMKSATNSVPILIELSDSDSEEQKKETAAAKTTRKVAAKSKKAAAPRKKKRRIPAKPKVKVEIIRENVKKVEEPKEERKDSKIQILDPEEIEEMIREKEERDKQKRSSALFMIDS